MSLDIFTLQRAGLVWQLLPIEDIFILYIYILEDDEVLVVEDGGGPPAPGGRGGSVRVLPAEVTLSAVTEFLQLASLSVVFAA